MGELITDNVQYLKYVITELSKAIDYKWKLQSYNKDKSKALCVAYIDSRMATQRLNEVCYYGWHREHFALGDDKYCRLGVVMPDGSIIWRSDVGESDNETEKSKTAASDSFKRAAKEFGLGLFLYDLEIVTLPVLKDGNYYNIVKDDGKSKVWNLTEYINTEYKKPIGTKSGKKPAKPDPIPVQKEEIKQSAIQPSEKFNDDKKKEPTTGEIAERKAKALVSLNELGSDKVLKHLLATNRVAKDQSVKLPVWVNNSTIEEVTAVYKELTAKK